MSLKSDAVFAKIQGRVAKVTGEERKIQHIFKFKIQSGGAVVKTWILDLKSLKVYAGDDANAEVTLILEDSVMVALGSGQLSPKDALAQDKLDIDGDIEVAMKLTPFISSL